MTDISSINGLNDGFSEHYTPTTEEVRNGYVGPWTGPNPDVSEDERTEFDRWLAEVKAEAWAEGVVACINETGMHNPYR